MGPSVYTYSGYGWTLWPESGQPLQGESAAWQGPGVCRVVSLWALGLPSAGSLLRLVVPLPSLLPWRLVVLTLPRDCLCCQRRSWPMSILFFPARCFVTIKGWPGGQPPPITELVPGCSWGVVGGGYEPSPGLGSCGPLPSDLSYLFWFPPSPHMATRHWPSCLCPLVLEKWANVGHLGQGGGHCSTLPTMAEGAFTPSPHHRRGGMRSRDLCPLTGVVITSLRVTVACPSLWAARPLGQMGICVVCVL